MRIIRKNETNTFKNSKSCIAIEYPLKDMDISGSVIRLKGRYPDTGKAINTQCKEMAYVIKGEGVIVFGKKRVKIAEGDLILINPMEAYHWEGNLEMFMPCSPAWTPEQHKILDA
jgi:mannose-6-phosphate isomerase-like protein (cupin superfamily)